MTIPHDRLTGSLRIDRTVVLTLAGEIDLATQSELRSLLDEAIASGDRDLSLDLTGVTFMGAAGLTEMLRAAEDLHHRDRDFTLRGTSAFVRRLLEITSLTEALPLHDTQRPPMIVQALEMAVAGRLARELLDAALRLVVSMTHAVVDGADGASITLPRQGELVTVASSNDVVLEMDGDQYATGEGPCLDAATSGHRFEISSLDNEKRWPEFVPRARARGIRSILSTPLISKDKSLGALNIYSRTVDAFAEHEQHWADRFAAEAAVLVGQSLRVPADAGLHARLQQALQTRETIAVAQGILMNRTGDDSDSAYVVLRDVSVRTGQPLGEVCERVIAANGGRGPRTAARGVDAHDAAPA
jgi:anti-anti-sigma factor